VAQKLTSAPESVFWYFINERHKIYVKRTAGEPKPWTDDPVLRDYKFTNVFRQLDRGTVWLTENFVKPHWDDDPALIVANVGWYRLFNWTGTGELLGWQTKWSRARVLKKLLAAQAAGKQIFTGAHIVWSQGGQPKATGVTGSCTQLWERRNYIAGIAKMSRSLQKTFDALTEIRGIGGFIAYEIVTDLRHTTVLNQARDINTWANTGPGALRGLQRMYPEMKAADSLKKMRALLKKSRQPGILGPHVPPLELRDIEHSLCECDKLCRIRFNEGQTRSKYPGRGEEIVV
jgi:hypothetical protein